MLARQVQERRQHDPGAVSPGRRAAAPRTSGYRPPAARGPGVDVRDRAVGRAQVDPDEISRPSHACCLIGAHGTDAIIPPRIEQLARHDDDFPNRLALEKRGDLGILACKSLDAGSVGFGRDDDTGPQLAVDLDGDLDLVVLQESRIEFRPGLVGQGLP